MKTTTQYPHVRLPKKIDQLLYILSQELKNNKVFDDLVKVGFDDTHSRSDFMSLVLNIVFKEDCEELTDIYIKLIIKHSKKLKDTNRSTLTKRAFKFYIDLMIEKKKRSEIVKVNR